MVTFLCPLIKTMLLGVLVFLFSLKGGAELSREQFFATRSSPLPARPSGNDFSGISGRRVQIHPALLRVAE